MSTVVCEGDVCRLVPSGDAKADASKSSPLIDLLGSELQGKDGMIPTSSITGPGKVLGIYFSAHWCPPCRGFTPVLAGIYKKFKESHKRKDDFEILFVSSDRDETAFDEYYAEMPWLALPFKDRERKAKLSSKFKVQGIPTFVILDGETGTLITDKGREAVAQDAECADFPWRPESLQQILSGATLVNKEGKEQPALEALQGKVALFYFSAHWCGPCRNFTPKLAETYQALKAAGKEFELVFVTSDRDEAGFKEYYGEMPDWLAVSWSCKKARDKLDSYFNVEGIPTLVVVDADLSTINDKARGAVGSDPKGENFPWRPKPVEALGGDTVEALNSEPLALLVLRDLDDKAAAARAEAVMQETAAKSKAAAKGGADPASFLWGVKRKAGGGGDDEEGDGLLERVMEFLQIPEDDVGAAGSLYFLNLPELGRQYSKYEGDVAELTAEGFAAEWDKFKKGELKKLGQGPSDD
mmetsp:Transcript_22632/g.49548  ORF Transcript_22632/g.49548 Transcript_22632/m.49548 type:complete len:469 (+) Transcript_22632:243-1649(+)|eukprot:CAMPEP_0202920238 /NCGR_PEP_ID=MMETSP1392-20130828/76751_1 /ASSEMBLY_ACC=CAM_ASM_000868 /TAXON_ID=225041 /ORGANISM="Chlamydomonas chlamydogama, Strain SAG 11-48b" /LENGTH=468 /DNA_ID=CAMNT_0049613723 /DNA_START=243 /DNA_END=1649 /DNA_ORIENTATION=+